MRNYFSAHNHTEFSNIKIIDSINRADRLIDYAWDLGLSGLAFTDHDCVSGSIKFIETYRKKLTKEYKALYPDVEIKENDEFYAAASNELGFKVVLGNEIYLSEEGSSIQSPDPHFWHLILIAKDAEGFKQIKQLSSAAWSRSWFKAIQRTPTYPSDLFEFVKGGHLICSTACLGGYTAWCWKQIESLKYQEVLPWETSADLKDANYYLAKLDNHLAAMTELFGQGNFFIELQPNDDVYGKEQNGYNKFMIERYWGKYPFIFTTDSHYLKAEEREVHKAFLNSKSSKDREVDDFYRYAYMMSQEEIRGLMPYVTDAQFEEMVGNTHKIWSMCEYYPLEQNKVIAKVEYEHKDEYEEDLQIFHEVTEEAYPNFYYYLTTDNEADHYLMELIAHGYVNKYEDDWDDETYFARLEEELWTIREVGNKINQSMSDYFTTISKMVELMWQAGSLVGPSRGSAGALLINYLLDITQMNPIKLDLPFVWRFMHPSRPDFPDVDIDSESDKRAVVFKTVQDYFRNIGGDVVNVCTFGTEGTKSALKTSARGLNIDDDLVSYMTSMIPNERGFDWSLSDCYYGSEKDDRAPIKEFVRVMDENPLWWQLAQSIEGLVTRLGVHASGVICVNGDFVNHGSYMKTNKGQIVTALDLHDQEKCGVLKYDMLTVSALDRIHQTLNYMLEDGTIEWQGSLKATYDKYLHPSVLDYNSPEMWRMASDGEIRSLFQFDTAVGSQSIKKIQPISLKQLAIANSIMRLMADGEQPIDIYVKQKMAPQLWYNDMYEKGLTADEIKVIEKYLLEKDGVAESQEVVMQLSMDPQISGFDMKDANRLRKIIAKKNFKDIEAMHQYFNECGAKLGTSQALLDYVWDTQFKLSFGYSFSTIHTTGYSLIALQEMNLAYHYPIIYWNTACLSIDSSAVSAQDFYNLIDEDILDVDNDDTKKTQNKMDYAKLAAALDSFKRSGCTIRLPDINESRLGFTPDVKTNSILYGLKGITKVTDPAINEIMANRPFKSFDDFLNRITRRIVTKDKIINLIKCGAFDRLENKNRRQILEEYIWQECGSKKKLTMQNANMLIDMNLLADADVSYQENVYKLTKELRKHRDPNKLWYCGDRLVIPEDKIELWRQIIGDSKLEVKEIVINDEPRRVISSSDWDRFYEINMQKIKTYIQTNHDALLQKLNNRLFMDEFNKYCAGDELQWELDSINFFFSGHPLDGALDEYDIHIDPIESIVEDAQDGQFVIKGKIIPKMKLYTVAATVIDRDNTKAIVTVQAPDGVLTLKLYKGLYAEYSKADEETGEESFFEKGVHLLITGIQRGSTFVPKVYKNTGRHSLLRIYLNENNKCSAICTKENADA